MELATGAHIDRFVIEATIGSGGMATVYRVRHRDLDTIHALKVLHLTHPSVQDRMIAEGRVQARLRHPNVVAVTDVLDVGGNPGLLMEYVRGPSLERVLSRARPDLSVIEQLVPGILAGVAAAHQAMVVHRDLKPGNILLEVGESDVRPKIADFGLVKLLDDHRTGLTRSGATMGTPNYMSPEQIKNARDVDHRTDVFALGVILYEMVTGYRAFESDNVFAILSAITAGRAIPIRERAPGLPDRMVEAIEAAMELDVEDRVSNCDDLWRIWSGRSEDLATAAARPVSLSPAWSLRFADLAPQTQVPPMARTTLPEPRPVAGPGTSGATFPVPDPVSRRAWVPAVTGGLVGLLLIGLGVMLGMGQLGVGQERGEAPASHPVVPVTAEVPATTAPQPAPRPAVHPVPAPPSPPPRREAPAKTPTAAPAAAPATAMIRVEGDARVRLVGAHGVAPSLQAVPAGTYRVEAIYDSDEAQESWTGVGRLVVKPGVQIAISCRSAIRNCKW